MCVNDLRHVTSVNIVGVAIHEYNSTALEARSKRVRINDAGILWAANSSKTTWTSSTSLSAVCLLPYCRLFSRFSSMTTVETKLLLIRSE